MAITAAVKYKLTLEYDGTGYRGWQTQQNARSVQGTLIQAAGEYFGRDVDVQGAGRTDAGVHALAQVAHLIVGNVQQPRKIREGLNDLLPAGINILKVEQSAADFHARHDAVARVYVYVISRVRTAFGKRYVWWVKDALNTVKMKEACQLFLGFHDFASFADRRLDRNASTKVQIDSIGIEEIGDLIIFRVAGSHFLWKMVRRMAGVLVEAGRGNLAKGDVEAMLTSRSELPAKLTAPPSGLFLAQVLYKGDPEERLHLPLPLFGNSSGPLTEGTAGNRQQAMSNREHGKGSRKMRQASTKDSPISRMGQDAYQVRNDIKENMGRVPKLPPSSRRRSRGGGGNVPKK
jgi:tRNA pseudouridine38-40 synthase